jgi:hypothetical protein
MINNADCWRLLSASFGENNQFRGAKKSSRGAIPVCCFFFACDIPEVGEHWVPRTINHSAMQHD